MNILFSGYDIVFQHCFCHAENTKYVNTIKRVYHNIYCVINGEYLGRTIGGSPICRVFVTIFVFINFQ